jgi:hypothetical protein
VVGISKGTGNTVSILDELRIVPPWERVCAEPLYKAKDGKKSSHPDDEIDEVAELGPGANGVND